MEKRKDHALVVLHIFSGDLWAGAEVMVFNLLSELKKSPNLKIMALSLNEGVLTEKLRKGRIETLVISEKVHAFPSIFLRAVRILKGQRIDVIHSHRRKENLLALLLSKSIGVKRLCATLHGLSEPLRHAENGDRGIPLKTRIDYFILKHFFTRIVAVSQEMREILKKKYHFSKEKLDMIYNGIPLPSRLSLPDSSCKGHFHIGTVGRLVPVKDFSLFLDTAAEISKQTDNVHFSILGDGPLKEELIKKARRLGIEDIVDFFPARADPESYYRSLDIYLNTSVHEGLPLSILEAMACGRPIVAPKVGGIPEIVSHGENGLLVKCRTPDAFSDCCLKLIKDEKLRMDFGNKALNKVTSCYDVSRMATSYMKLYNVFQAER